MLQMKVDELVHRKVYFSRLVTLTNQMKSNNEELSKQAIVEKVLRMYPKI